MILKGNQRAGGGQLARHLLNDRDNDHVAIHDLRGFISEDLNGAFTEAFAVSQGTRCKQFLFSLSLNPPENARVPIAVFEAAIDKIEERLGLSNQPRAIVFHEKEGRRHAHCVWSRINTAEMKAINLPHYKMRLRDISRQLFLENDWRMPRGLQNALERDPLGFSQAEHQQAKRTDANAVAIKKIFKECWAASDSAVSFGHALKEHGYRLARGNRRGHVAVNADGEVFSVSRWLDLKAKDVRAKLGDGLSLPSVGEAQAGIKQNAKDGQRDELDEALRQIRKKLHDLEAQRVELVKNQRAERRVISEKQVTRRDVENRIRAARLPTGLKALWFRVTGKYQKIAKRNAEEKSACDTRDSIERQRLIDEHLRERQRLLTEMRVADLEKEISLESTRRSDSQRKKMGRVQRNAIRNTAKKTILRG
jgi:hypothetical protein